MLTYFESTNRKRIFIACISLVCGTLLIWHMQSTDRIFTRTPFATNRNFLYARDYDDTAAVAQPSNASVRVCTSRERFTYIRRQCTNKHVMNAGRDGPYRADRHKLLVNDDRGLSYCYIPKVASSTLKAIMIASVQKGNGNVTSHGSIGRVHEPDKLREHGLRVAPLFKGHALTNYTNVVVLRHPFERMISAFHEKILGSKGPAYESRRNAITNAYRKRGKSHSKPVTFGEFVDYVFAGHPNHHWSPYALRCHLCSIKYTHVLKLETFSSDIPSFLDDVGLERSIIETHSRNRKRSHSNATQTTQILVKPRDMPEFRDLTKRQIDKLLKLFKRDLLILGYGYNRVTRQSTCRIKLENGEYCC